MKYIIIAILAMAVLSPACIAGPGKLELKEGKDKTNYSLGYQIGNDLKQQEVTLNSEAFLQGVQDALADAEPLMPPDDMRTTLVNLKKKITAEQQGKKPFEKYHEEDRKFLEENAKKDGVTTLPSGLQYKVMKQGTGKSPKKNDSVTFHFHGTLVDGKIFGSSYRDNKSTTFRVDKLIPGLTEGLQLMKEGAKWQLFIPPELAFGRSGPVAERAVIYEVELISIQPSDAN